MSKKPKKVKDPIKDLAADILKSDEDIENGMDVEDVPEVPIVEEPKKYGKIPTDEKEETVKVEPVKFDMGISKANPFVLSRRIDEMYKILAKYFGREPGDYFIGNENTTTSVKDGVRKRFKCIIVEDKYKFTYTLWFDVTSLGMIY